MDSLGDRMNKVESRLTDLEKKVDAQSAQLRTLGCIATATYDDLAAHRGRGSGAPPGPRGWAPGAPIRLRGIVGYQTF
jgi:hypothetical protein